MRYNVCICYYNPKSKSVQFSPAAFIVYSCNFLNTSHPTPIVRSSSTNVWIIHRCLAVTPLTSECLTPKWSRWLCKMIIWPANANSWRLFTIYSLLYRRAHSTFYSQKGLFCQAINGHLLNFVWKFSTKIPAQYRFGCFCFFFFFCWSVVANLKSKSQILGQDKRAGLSHTLPNCRHTCRERPLSRWAAEPLKKLGFWPREPADIAHVSCRWLAISQGCSLRSFSYWLLAIALPDI